MKLKKLFTLILSLALALAVFGLPAEAEEWDGGDFTLTVPEEFVYIMTPYTAENDPVWALAKIVSATETIQEYQDDGVLADFRTEDGFSVKLRQKSNDTTESIYTLRDMDEAELTEFVASMVQSQTEDLTVENEIFSVEDQPFYQITIEGVVNEEEVHEVMQGTFINGYNLWVDTYSVTEFTEEQLALVDALTNSMRFVNVLPRPETEPVDAALLLLLLAVLVIIIVAPLVYLPLQKRWDKKEKAKMADRLSQYRKEHPGDALSGVPLFVNETDCTREAIRAFSLYHVYGKGLPSLLVGAIMCAAVLIATLVFDMTWWLKIIAAVVAVYFAYKTISAPRNFQKVQEKVYGRGTSQTARYTFYEDGFRVAGVQSASTFPYFQISTVRRRGQYLYLYYGPDNAYMVDRYGFSLGEFEEFEKFIQQKVKEKD